MGPLRNVPVKGFIELCLPTCIDQMIIAPDNVGDAHIMVIHNNCEHIGWGTIGAQ